MAKKIQNLIVNSSNPWPLESCQKEVCFLCQNPQNKVMKCKIDNITYKIVCTKCKENNVKSIYHGESGRKIFSPEGWSTAMI